MIELTTSVAFLLTSMYGSSGTANNTLSATVADTSMDRTASLIVANDRKAVEKYLRQYFADTPILVEIARCESTFTHYKNGELVRGNVDKADVGVMQINERYHLETATKLGFNIHTIEGNVAYARYLYEKSGSKPWSASEPCWGKTIVAMNTK